MVSTYGPTFIPGFGAIPPPPTPPVLIPPQITRAAKPTMYTAAPVVAAQPAVVSAKPSLYSAPKLTTTQATQAATAQASVDFMAIQSEVEKKLKKLKNEKVSAELAISQGMQTNHSVIV